MTTPRVSVIVPAFEAMEFLPETVASVLAQTYRDYEVVIVDDGSSDGVAHWVEGLGRADVRCVRQPNAGQASARNRGITETRSELVALLDADDVWHPTKLARQVAAMDAAPAAGLVHCGVRYVDQRGAPLNAPLGVVGDGAVWDQIVLSNSRAGVKCGSTPLIRRACFEEVGLFDTDLAYSEDWDMWLRIAARFDFLALDEFLVDYRQHAGNVTKNYGRILENQKVVLDKTFSEHPDAPRRLRRQAYSQSMIFASWRAHFALDGPVALRHFGSAVACDPTVLLRKNTLNLALRLVRSAARSEERTGEVERRSG